MSLVEDILPGSYKNIPFLFRTSTVTGGIKDVKHSYPNSNKQNIEYLGTDPRAFNMRITITGSGPLNEDYKQVRDTMLAALDKADTPGKLTHPLYGDIENIVCRSWTISEELASLGQGVLTIVFEVDEGPGTPEKSGTTLVELAAGSAAVISAISTGVAENYEVTDSYTNSFQDSVDKLNAVVDEFNNNTDVLQANADKIDAYSQQITDFSNNIASLVKNPQALATSIDTLFETVGGLYTTADGTLTVLTGFFDFGDDDIDLLSETISKIERTKNRALMNGALQGQALSYAYVNAAEIDYKTVDEIDSVSNTLENQYQKLIASDNLDSETKSNLTDLRVTMQSFLQGEKLTAKQVIEVETNPISSSLLSYQYYGSSEFGNDLADLNSPENPSFLQGTIKILTA